MKDRVQIIITAATFHNKFVEQIEFQIDIEYRSDHHPAIAILTREQCIDMMRQGFKFRTVQGTRVTSSTIDDDLTGFPPVIPPNKRGDVLYFEDLKIFTRGYNVYLQ